MHYFFVIRSTLDISDTFDGQPSRTLRKEEGEEKKDGVGHSLQQQAQRKLYFLMDTRSQPQRGQDKEDDVFLLFF